MVSNYDIPIAIVILNNNGEIIYKAFSPFQYNSDTTEDYNLFLDRLYNYLGYDTQNPLNNYTHYGNLLEIHTRHLHTSLGLRGNILYASTYSHQYCNYNPIHHHSPLFFNYYDAQHYDEIDQNLNRVAIPHVFI